MYWFLMILLMISFYFPVPTLVLLLHSSAPWSQEGGTDTTLQSYTPSVSAINQSESIISQQPH